jgi:Ca-activated chloride channel homolog
VVVVAGSGAGRGLYSVAAPSEKGRAAVCKPRRRQGGHRARATVPAARPATAFPAVGDRADHRHRRPQRGTATGSAIYVALQTLFPDEGIDLESLLFKGAWSRNNPLGNSLDAKPKPAKKEVKPVEPGSYSSAVIILLSDGRRTMGPDPLDAAHMAADHGVRIFTVGFGTAEGGSIGFEGWSAFVRLDEETLKAVADITRGEYFYAGSSADLHKVYQGLTTKLVLEKKDTEISFLFAAIATALLLAAMLLSLLWFNRST